MDTTIVPRNLVPARVLLVDDEPLQLEVRAEVLKMCGFLVVTAPGPTEAMSIIAAMTEKIDVAVLDYQMPIMNGCILADKLRSRRPEVKIILHSGAFDIPQQEMTSVDLFIPKSEGVTALIENVRAFAVAGTSATDALMRSGAGMFRIRHKPLRNCDFNTLEY